MTQTLKSLKEENKKLKELSVAKSDMVSISAHQVRSSLSAIKWIIKMFLDGDLGSMTTEQTSLLSKAYDSNDKAINILNELLLTNKTEAVVERPQEFEKIDIVELIENTIFNFSGETHARGIEIIFLKSGIKIKTVRADKEHLSVVLQNLIENAIKYSNMHGKIFITLKKDDDFMQVSVKDKGVTISEEGKKHVFQKFYRDEGAQKKEAMGSGMGLYTTKKIIEEAGGKIWFESTKEDGTTFFCTVPLSD